MNAFATAAFAAAFAFADAELCSSSVLWDFLSKYSEDFVTCEDDAGYTLLPSAGWPSEDQFMLLCASDACGKTIAALKDLPGSDCDFEVGGRAVNLKKLVDSFSPTCYSFDLTPAPVERCNLQDLVVLEKLRNGSQVGLCEDDSGYKFLPTSSWPIEDEFRLICASQACVDTVDTLKALGPRDCEYSVNGSNINFKKLVDRFAPTCASF